MAVVDPADFERRVQDFKRARLASRPGYLRTLGDADLLQALVEQVADAEIYREEIQRRLDRQDDS